MSVVGLRLASNLAEAGLVDEYRFYFFPVPLGAGRSVFSEVRNRVTLKTLETHTFGSGTILVRCIPSGR